ncbi:MAG TPA: hypothetical protein VJN18_35605 [Polyangiaceae bacterium]|nr:hypothetical protein [Polyangiaceae bacterium]
MRDQPIATCTLRIPYLRGKAGTPAEGSSAELVLEDVPVEPMLATLEAVGYVVMGRDEFDLSVKKDLDAYNLAVERATTAERERDEARALLEEALRREADLLDVCWEATGVASTVRGLTTLDDVIRVGRAKQLEAEREVERSRAELVSVVSSALDVLSHHIDARPGSTLFDALRALDAKCAVVALAKDWQPKPIQTSPFPQVAQASAQCEPESFRLVREGLAELSKVTGAAPDNNGGGAGERCPTCSGTVPRWIIPTGEAGHYCCDPWHRPPPARMQTGEGQAAHPYDTWRPAGPHVLDEPRNTGSPFALASDAWCDHTGKFREAALSKSNVIGLLIRAVWQLARKVDRLEAKPDPLDRPLTARVLCEALRAFVRDPIAETSIAPELATWVADRLEKGAE